MLLGTLKPYYYYCYRCIHFLIGCQLIPGTLKLTVQVRYFYRKAEWGIPTQKSHTAENENLVPYSRIFVYAATAFNAEAKRKEATCYMAMPQCCYLAKGAKRPSHTTNLLFSSKKSSSMQLAVMTLKASNLNSAVWDQIFCCMNRP